MAGAVDRRPFKVGGATVDPVSRDASWPGGKERLQPQTLKVLRALVSHRGEVVTRDELVQLCWDGRIVGDDVINRSILLLRQFAEHAGGFEIETVPRTGYRLIETPPVDSGARSWLGAARARLDRKTGIAAAVALLVGVSGLLLFERLGRPTPDAVMLEPFDVAGNAPSARTLAGGVFADVGNALSAAGVKVVDAGATNGSARARFVLGGRAELPGSNLHLTVELEDTRDHAIVWSTDFTRPSSQIQSMQEQVAANIAAVLHCALDTSQQPPGEPLDQETVSLYLKACALLQTADAPSQQASNLLAQVTLRRPGFAPAWAWLALSSADASLVAPSQEAVKLRERARGAAAAALRLNPRSGLAYQALADMKLGRAPYSELHRDFQKALGVDPNNAGLLNDDGELLMRMGSEDEALQRFRKGVELDPLSPLQATDLIRGLINDSRGEEAKVALQKALRVWPDDEMLRIIHLDFEARFDEPAAALLVINDPEQRPKVRDITLEAYRRLVEARRSNRPAPFIAWAERQFASGQLSADFAAPQLARFGERDAAFAMAFAAPVKLHVSAPETDPEFLWQPESISLRRDPRFVALARKFLVAEFWQSTGLWPDFCSDRRWTYDCKAEARRGEIGPGR